jgi:hypothetical protein
MLLDGRSMPEPPVSQADLNSLNHAQSLERNLASLAKLGGIEDLLLRLHIDVRLGLSEGQYEIMRIHYGSNELPETPLTSFLSIWIGTLNDFLIIVLMVAGGKLHASIPPHTMGFVSGLALRV